MFRLMNHEGRVGGKEDTGSGNIISKMLEQLFKVET